MMVGRYHGWRKSSTTLYTLYLNNSSILGGPKCCQTFSIHRMPEHAVFPPTGVCRLDLIVGMNGSANHQ